MTNNNSTGDAPASGQQQRDVTPTAAGPWQEGRPVEHGRYLVEYEQHNQCRVFVADWDAIEAQWANLMPDTTVLRYARINSQYV